ncbi:hypothetical protein [Telluribacter humicola]|nr:hypothetical protein [Telluribacter humicola]
MQQHEPTMCQMVSEIHQGKLNIAQAAAKFKANRKTVYAFAGVIAGE